METFESASTYEPIFYQEDFIQTPSEALSFQNSSDYMIKCVDTSTFTVYATKTFDTLAFGSPIVFQSAKIIIGTLETQILLSQIGLDLYSINFPMLKDCVYTVMLSDESAINPPPFNICMMKIYPSPAINWTQIDYYSPRAQNVSISVFNILGQNYLSRTYPSILGVNQIPLNLSGMPSGVYFIQLENGSERIKSRFIRIY